VVKAAVLSAYQCIFINKPIIIQIGYRNSIIYQGTVNGRVNVEPAICIKIALIADDIVYRERKYFFHQFGNRTSDKQVWGNSDYFCEVAYCRGCTTIGCGDMTD
jgi:hypothetical protein